MKSFVQALSLQILPSSPPRLGWVRPYLDLHDVNKEMTLCGESGVVVSLPRPAPSPWFQIQDCSHEVFSEYVLCVRVCVCVCVCMYVCVRVRMLQWVCMSACVLHEVQLLGAATHPPQRMIVPSCTELGAQVRPVLQSRSGLARQ